MTDIQAARSKVLPRSLRGIEFDHLDVDDANRAAIEAARCWGDIPPASHRGLMLVGPVGTGKTLLAAAAARLMMKHMRVRWCSVPEILSMSMGPFDSPERAQAHRVLMGTDFDRSFSNTTALVLDDIDKAQGAEWAATQLFIAIDTQINNGGPLLVTSNLDPEELSKRFAGMYGQAIVSRLVSRYFKVVKVGGADRRLK